MATQTKGAGRSFRHIFVFISRAVEKNLAGSKEKQEYDARARVRACVRACVSVFFRYAAIE